MDFEIDFKISCRVLAPKGWTADMRGNYFEKISAKLLKKQRYEIAKGKG